VPGFPTKLSYLAGTLVLAGMTYRGIGAVSPTEARRLAHSAASEAEAPPASNLLIIETQADPPARFTPEPPRIAERDAVPTADLRDPAVDRTLHERALALGEARLAELERQVQATADSPANAVSFRAARLRRWLAAARAAEW
jgi:hypothetical protein